MHAQYIHENVYMQAGLHVYYMQAYVCKGKHTHLHTYIHYALYTLYIYVCVTGFDKSRLRRT